MIVIWLLEINQISALDSPLIPLNDKSNEDQSAWVVEYTDCISVEGKDLLNGYPAYDTKQSDGEALVMLEFWGMQSASLLLSLPGPLWPGVIASDRMSQTELNCVLMLNWIVWNRSVYFK